YKCRKNDLIARFIGAHHHLRADLVIGAHHHLRVELSNQLKGEEKSSSFSFYKLIYIVKQIKFSYNKNRYYIRSRKSHLSLEEIW
ncbi:MAG: hypothetical protein EGR79_09255, partial [Ruminococcaceae bacterium]|nr:hypothetical protein [Oscillospiraceae bacterium]